MLLKFEAPITHFIRKKKEKNDVLVLSTTGMEYIEWVLRLAIIITMLSA